MTETELNLKMKTTAVVGEDDTSRTPADLTDSEPEQKRGAVVRTRRARRRRAGKMPYSKEGQQAERRRRARARAELRARAGISAPYNTTQFLISDQAGAAGTELYEAGQTGEEFLRAEFRRDYATEHLARLTSISKEKLISEFLLLERRNEVLTERLGAISRREAEKARHESVEYDFHRGEVPMEPDTAQKIQIFQKEINLLKAENQSLVGENLDLTAKLGSLQAYSEPSQLSSSTDCSSSSSDSSSEDSDDSDEDSVEEENDAVQKKDESPTVDTGYESTQS